jgi:hypothetical protein
MRSSKLLDVVARCSIATNLPKELALWDWVLAIPDGLAIRPSHQPAFCVDFNRKRA